MLRVPGLLLQILVVVVGLMPAAAGAQAPGADNLATLEQGVHEVRLSNGLRVLLYRRDIAPVFAGVVAVRVGSADEPAGFTGASHLLEHMAFKGTPQLGSKDYPKEKTLLDQLDAIMAAAGGGTEIAPADRARVEDLKKQLAELWEVQRFEWEYQRRGAQALNATTSTDLTNYFVALPRNALEFWCWIETERILHPVMRQFYTERDVVLEERRMSLEDDPQGKLYAALLQAAFERHPYRNPIVGYEQDLWRMTAQAVLDYQRRYYVASNMTVVLVGDVHAERDLPMIRRYFERIPAGEAPRGELVHEPLQQHERRVTVVHDASPELMVAYHKPVYPHPDDPRLAVLMEILAGGVTSPLYEELVKKQQIVSQVEHFDAPGSAQPNLTVFYLQPRAPHTAEEALRAFDRVLGEFVRNPVDPDRIARAKRAVTMSYLERLDSNLSLGVDLASFELISGGWRNLLAWYREVQQVGPEDLTKVAREYLIPSRRTVAWLEPRKQGG